VRRTGPAGVLQGTQQPLGGVVVVGDRPAPRQHLIVGVVQLRPQLVEQRSQRRSRGETAWPYQARTSAGSAGVTPGMTCCCKSNVGAAGMVTVPVSWTPAGFRRTDSVV
jgi:hypothetical protein